MYLLPHNHKEINNEVSALLRVVRSHYQNEIKLQIMNVICIREFKLKVLRKTHGYYKFLFLIKIPKDYPFEPLWAEPVIVCKQMRSQFPIEHFKSHKLRPLIDNVLRFCHKFEYVNTQNLEITFPFTRLYDDGSVTAKVLILINKALSKLSCPLSNSIQGYVNPKMVAKMILNSGISIHMVEHVHRSEKLNGRTEKYLKVKNLPNKLIYEKHVLLRSCYQNVASQLPQRISKKSNSLVIHSVRKCKLNFCEVKNLMANFLMISSSSNMVDFSEDFTVELGESLRIRFMMIYNSLVVQEKSLSFVNSSFTILEERVDSLRNINCLELLPLRPMELISLCTQKHHLQMFLRSLYPPRSRKVIHINFGEEEEYEEGLEVGIERPMYLMISNQTETALTDVVCISRVDCLNMVSKMREEPLTKASMSFNDIFKAERITNGALTFLEEVSSNDVVVVIPSGTSPLTLKCSDLIAEIIHYPLSSSDTFEYTMDLNPRDNRHRALLSCIGILEHQHHAEIEIVASSDYELDHFFVKEIVNPNSSDFMIRLRKLPPENYISHLVKEENMYFKRLVLLNRMIWCMAVPSGLTFHLLSPAYCLANMYLRKLKRKRLMRAEASKHKCADLPIRRCHFYKEFVESLSIVTHSL